MLDTSKFLHAPMAEYWFKEHEFYTKNCRKIPTRFERAEKSLKSQRAKGDELLAQLYNVFHNGFGIKWSPVQAKIFTALINSILPRIYLDEWNEAKIRVMLQRKIKKIFTETLVNMARRNGKSMVVSGVAATLFLVVPGITIAVFSVGKRQASMFNTLVIEKIERAFTIGIVRKEDYQLVQKNQENLIYMHPDGSKQHLMCLPGSTKVRNLFFLFSLLSVSKRGKLFNLFVVLIYITQHCIQVIKVI